MADVPEETPTTPEPVPETVTEITPEPAAQPEHTATESAQDAESGPESSPAGPADSAPETVTTTIPAEPSATPAEPSATPAEPSATGAEPSTTPAEPSTTPAEPLTTGGEPIPVAVGENADGSMMEAACGVGGSWWGGWIQAAKDKSVSALEFVKKDIEEFTSTMQVDSNSLTCTVRSKLNQETATAATQKVKQGVSLLLGGIKTALIIPPEEMDDEAEPITVGSGTHIFDRAKARLHAVQIDPGTYSNEPSGSKAEFEAWKKTMDLEGKKGEISELLVSHVQVRALYTQMVPTSVSHADFWQRYFYKLYQLDQEEQRRADLKKRAESTATNDDLAWDDEDDWENMEGGPPSNPIKDDAKSENTTTTTTTPESSTRPEHSTPSDIASPTDTVSTATDSTTTDSKTTASSAETLTIVSADGDATDTDGNHDNKDLVTKEKGDIVLVGGNNSGSEGTSPANSDSHNKESTDEDWEKDFDIEVTEEELKQAKDEVSTEKKGSKEDEDKDWENWE